QGAAMPYVSFTSRHTPDLGLDNTVLANGVIFTVRCWDDDAAGADAVADQVVSALAAAGVVCTARDTGLDAALGLDATILTAEWWD
ncbi:MAG: hypothetical protein OEW22_03595, partial [Rubrivivax sp.]|nr:hypothetical protein [Rubrivivax sp.]